MDGWISAISVSRPATLSGRQLEIALKLGKFLHDEVLIPLEVPSFADLGIFNQVHSGLGRMEPSHFDPRLPQKVLH